MVFECKNKYIILPVNSASKVKRLKFYHNGEILLELDAAFDFVHPRTKMYYDISRFEGMTLDVKCDDLDAISISQTNTADISNMYNEWYRPQVRFSAPLGWLNDPNGLVYYGGKYHMFYQHNPVGTDWGNMHWGHAVSDDLFTWQHMDEALFPDKLGMMFSGSAIVDKKNLLGVKEGNTDTLVLFYTAANGYYDSSENDDFVQCMAYSTDGGVTFKKYENNPIIPHIAKGNRDPKVIYNEKTDTYIMSLFLDENRYILLKSENLVDWTEIQRLTLEDDNECPDFYPLTVSGNEIVTKWVLSGAHDQYVIGDFDGEIFVPETESKTLGYGDGYASQSWDNTGLRRIRTSWMRHSIPSDTFNNSMTIPCQITLHQEEFGMNLKINPVEEITQLYTKTETENTIQNVNNYKKTLDNAPYDISFDVNFSDDSVFTVSIFGTKITFDTISDTVKCKEIAAPLYCSGQTFNVRLISDANGVEVFTDFGTTYVICGDVADYTMNYIKFETANENVTVSNLKINKLKSRKTN